jgi:hypothetical protein
MLLEVRFIDKPPGVNPLACGLLEMAQQHACFPASEALNLTEVYPTSPLPGLHP